MKRASIRRFQQSNYNSVTAMCKRNNQSSNRHNAPNTNNPPSQQLETLSHFESTSSGSRMILMRATKQYTNAETWKKIPTTAYGALCTGLLTALTKESDKLLENAILKQAKETEEKE
eukprot:1118326_1